MATDTSNLPTCLARICLEAPVPLEAAIFLASEINRESEHDGYLYYQFNDHSVLGFKDGKPFHLHIGWDLDVRANKWVLPLLDDEWELDEENLTFIKTETRDDTH